MADSDGGATIEFGPAQDSDEPVRPPSAALARGPAASVPSPGALRDQLPGLEPERRVTDWGRSERIEHLADRTVYSFLYHYWFRVEVDGIDHLPSSGGALVLANHAGLVPADAAMVAAAVRRHHPARRTVHIAGSRPPRGLPGVGMLATKLGWVGGDADDLHRLLFDEREVVLAFPERGAGAAKPLRERYGVRRLDEHWIAAAARAEAPIVPLAILGAEEAQPVVFRLPGLRRRRALPVGPPLPLPAKLRLRFLPPLPAIGEDPAAVQARAHEVRSMIQEHLFELVAQRRNVWLG